METNLPTNSISNALLKTIIRLPHDDIEFETVRYKGILDSNLITTVKWYDILRDRQFMCILHSQQDEVISAFTTLANKYPNVSLQFSENRRHDFSFLGETLPLANGGLLRYGIDDTGNLLITFDKDEPKQTFSVNELCNVENAKLFVDAINQSVSYRQKLASERMLANQELKALIEKYDIGLPDDTDDSENYL